MLLSKLTQSFVPFAARRFTAAALIFAFVALSAVSNGPARSAAPPPSAKQPPTILVLGDSISAGYGIRMEEGWVALLQARLRREGYGYRVVNASVSGETTTGGLARLPRALRLHSPEIVILELGGNDGLRGLPLADTRRNLARMAELSREAGASVLLVGMKIPPNYGPRYADGFERVFAELAAERKLPLVPFFLADVALAPGLMQEDGLHPTAAAQPRLVATLWPYLEPLLGRPAARRKAAAALRNPAAPSAR